MSEKFVHSGITRDLGDGLILRAATSEDTEPLARFLARVFGSPDHPEEPMAFWARDIMSGNTPGVGPQDVTLVVDTTTGAIVSSLDLISQTWRYEDIPFRVGRIELVATDPDYRRRGLVREQMDVVHRWSAKRGEIAQAIAGIPWYYRQFGYEMALENMGGRTGYKPNVPALKEGEADPYRIRPASENDISFLERTYREGTSRYEVSCLRDEEVWRFDLTLRSRQASHYREIRVIESAAGDRIGMLAHPATLGRDGLSCTVYELVSGVSWAAVTPSIVRYLSATGEQYARDQGKTPSGSFTLALGSWHPAYSSVLDRTPAVSRPYAWYMRVPDLKAFVSHIAPALERRLAASSIAGHTGDLKLNFVGRGIRVLLKEGEITGVEDWKPEQLDSMLFPRKRDALLPGLTFLQLLFGHRSVEDLESAFPDFIVSASEARQLLNALFPRRPSRIWGIE